MWSPGPRPGLHHPFASLSFVGASPLVFASHFAARAALVSPGIADDDRQAVLDDLGQAMGLDDGVRSFLRVVLQAGRILCLGAIAQAYTELYEDRFRVRTAHVETASPLGEKEAAELTEKLEALTGARIELEVRDNPALLAGWRARVGNHLIEADLASRAERLADRVAKG